MPSLAVWESNPEDKLPMAGSELPQMPSDAKVIRMTSRDKYGWPVERIKGRPITNFIRLLLHTNLSKTLGLRCFLSENIAWIAGALVFMQVVLVCSRQPALSLIPCFLFLWLLWYDAG